MILISILSVVYEIVDVLDILSFVWTIGQLILDVFRRMIGDEEATC